MSDAKISRIMLIKLEDYNRGSLSRLKMWRAITQNVSVFLLKPKANLEMAYP